MLVTLKGQRVKGSPPPPPNISEISSPFVGWTIVFRLCHLLGLSINFAIIPAGKVLVTVASRGALVAEVPRREVRYEKQ